MEQSIGVFLTVLSAPATSPDWPPKLATVERKYAKRAGARAFETDSDSHALHESLVFGKAVLIEATSLHAMDGKRWI